MNQGLSAHLFILDFCQNFELKKRKTEKQFEVQFCIHFMFSILN